jgi:hypothetical protein
MKGLVIRSFVALTAILLFLPFTASPDNSAWAHPFQLRIVDQQTGQGLPHVRLTSDNGLVCYTRPDGSVPWTETSLMGRDVAFQIDVPGAQRTVRVRVIPGGRAEVLVTR